VLKTIDQIITTLSEKKLIENLKLSNSSTSNSSLSKINKISKNAIMHQIHRSDPTKSEMR
jgi:hypothetical protein